MERDDHAVDAKPREGRAAIAATWISAMLIVAAGVSLVWPVNNPYLSGECAYQTQRKAADASRETEQFAETGEGDGITECPVLWDRVDNSSIPGAAGMTLVLLAFAAFPLVRPRWYARLVALIPLIALAFLGVFIFGPVYVPAMLMMLLATVLPDRASNADR